MTDDEYQNIKKSIRYGCVHRFERDEVRQSARAGNPNGQLLAGLLARHPRTRRRWLFRAAGQGHAEACYQLYQDDLSDQTWLHRAAELGWSAARRELGRYYETLPEPDLVQSRYWYLQAAQGGDGVGMYEIAWSLLLGEGGPADPMGAIEWFERAAEAEAHTAEIAVELLHELYSDGKDVTKDAERADYWRQRYLAHQLGVAAGEGDIATVQALVDSGCPRMRRNLAKDPPSRGR